MNKIFKNVWNHFRGQVVCVSEKSASHDHSSANDVVDSTCEHASSNVHKTFVRTGVSSAVLLSLLSFQPAQAAINYEQWGAEAGVTTETITKNLDRTGSTYGDIKGWEGSWDTRQKKVLTLTEGLSLRLGVYAWDGEFWGVLGETGLNRQWAMINHGTIEDDTNPANGVEQVGCLFALLRAKCTP